MNSRPLGWLAALAAIAVASALLAQKVEPPKSSPKERVADVGVTGHIVKPPELPPIDPAKLKVPPGFSVDVFAKDLGNARILAVSPAGNVYVTRREQGDVLLVKFGAEPVRVAARPQMHGIAFDAGKVFLVTVKELFTADVNEDGTFGDLRMILADLPDAGQHHNRTLRVGPDGLIYLSVGSTCNECNESNPENATMLQISPDGKQRKIFAAGLRNTIGFDWHPETGHLWGMDHGIDWLGDDEQPEELNLIQEGKHYGWPWHFADNRPNPHTDPPAGIEKSEWKAVSVPMSASYVAHSAPMQMSFYNGGQFPSAYQGNAFVTMRGSWNRKPPSGYEVVRVKFAAGKPAGFEPFLTGFLTPEGQHARPCGLAIDQEGSLLFSDDRNGTIYRVKYTAKGSEATAKPVKPKVAPKPKPKAKVDPIALNAPETKTEGKLTVTSSAFKAGERVPLKFSQYDQNTSIPLAWTPGPAGTKSYAVFMDDPDADLPKLPVAHWVAWNVPGTSLPEGLLPQHRLLDSKGMRQGVNYSGKVGYAGPKPPPGDPAHHYHLQVFALDTALELPLTATRDDLLRAIDGHVLAKGEIIGLFEKPPEPKKP